MNRSELNQTSFLQFLWIWRKPILIITAAGAVAAVVVSLFMTDYFKAVAVIAPTKTNSVAFGENGRNNVAEFGDEEDAQRLLMVLQSPEIRDSLIKRYHLYEHYGIDSSENYARYKFQQEYDENVSFERTRENAINIEVLDTDPKIAMNMANDIVRLADTVMNRMIRQRSIPPMYAVQEEVKLILEQLSDYQDKLKALRDSGVVGKDERSELYTNLIEANKIGNQDLAAELKRKVRANEKFGSDYDIYSDLSESFGARYADILDINDQAKQYAQTNIQQTLRRNMAELPDKKYLPKRSIIVLVSTLASFLFACVCVIGFVRFTELRKSA